MVRRKNAASCLVAFVMIVVGVFLFGLGSIEFKVKL